MKSQLSKSIADHIIVQNEKLKNEIIYLKRDLKKFQDKMIETLDLLTSSISTKTKDYKKLLLFNTPYECLFSFVQQITKSADFSVKTSSENSILLVKNKQISTELQKIKDQSIERIKKQEQVIEQLNKQINIKKQKLIELQNNYQELLKAKKVAQKQLNQTKQHMKILRLKLYEQQRQKLTQIIVANKKQMIDFRKTMQMQTYKQELQFRKQISQKEKQIKLLTRNVQELANNSLSSTSDLTILQKIVKPLRQSTELKDQIVNLKKQVSFFKQESREKHSTILGLQGKLADITLSRDNLRSHNQRLDIEKNLLTINLNQKTQELYKSQHDKKAMQVYYSQKWHSQFSKVKDNLQSKYTKRTQNLQKEYQQKKKQVQAQIEVYLQRIRLIKAQLSVSISKNQELTQINAILTQKISNLQSLITQLHINLRQTDHFHQQQIQTKTLKWKQLSIIRQSKIQNLQNSLKIHQQQLNNLKSQFLLQKNKLSREKYLEIQSIKKQHSTKIQSLQIKHKKQIKQLEIQYSNSKQAIQAFRLLQITKYQQKQKSLFQRHQQQLKQAENLSQLKIQKLNQKLGQSDIKYQKLRKRRQDESKQNDQKIIEFNKVLHQRQHQLVARDVQIQEYKKMKDTYMTEITKINQQLTQSLFQKQSLQVQLQSCKKKIQQKKKQIQQLQNQKFKFKQDLLNFQKSYKKQFQQLNRNNKRLIAQFKSRIWELESLFQKRPIKKKDFQQIQSLEKQNFSLKTEIHLKQAQNLILSQVKQYYEQKALRGNLKEQAQKSQQKLFLSTNGLLGDRFMYNSSQNQGQYQSHDIMKQTIKYKKPLYVKKPSYRKNKILSTSFKKLDLQQEQEQIKLSSQHKQMKQMKSYILRQGKVQHNSLIARNRTVDQRVKSSMM